jgi:hypothetical protein
VLVLNKRIGVIFILSLLIVVGIGCGEKPLTESDSVKGQGVNNDQDNTSKSTNDVVIPAETTSTDNKETVVNVAQGDASSDEAVITSNDTVSNEKIEVYFTDPQAMELIKTEQDIQFSNNNEKYNSAFKGLQNNTNPDLIPLWEKIELKTLSFLEGNMTLDIHMPDEARLGASGEQFALSALKKTMFQFEEVKSI